MAGETELGQPALRLDGVSHDYGSVRALDNIDLDVAPGAMTALIGPDGVGKSTLLGIAAGVRRMQGGRGTVLGHDLRRRDALAAIHREVAYLPQGLGQNLYGDLTVRENIAFFARLFGLSGEMRDRRIDVLLQSTDLLRFGDRRADQLSGGMKQKLGLCCSLVHEPRIVILDEPTTGIDPLSRRRFWDLIASFRAALQDMTVVVATAYMEEALRFDHLVMMNDGRIIAAGAPDELMAESGTDDLDAAYMAFTGSVLEGQGAARERPPYSGGRESAITAHGLTKRFGDFTAVDHVDFDIERGEVFGFVGPNGCGKTTTMKMLTGLLPPSEGEALLFGRRIEEDGNAIRRRIGYMSQSFSLYGELTVRQNLVLHGRLFDVPSETIKSRVRDLEERFGLIAYAGKQASGLPLGVRQRLSLAVAVIHRPEILILDEPTSGVDPAARERFWSLIFELSRNEGITVFVSTHYLGEAERCDRIALMNAGRVLAIDRPAEIAARARPADLETAFIELIEEDETRLRREETTGERREPATIADAYSGGRCPRARPHPVRDSLRRLGALARRESIELVRDRFRLVASLLIPPVLMVVFGYGLSLDIENQPYVVLDHDRTAESRAYLDGYGHSRYFAYRGPVASGRQLEVALERGDARLAIEIPAGFGRDLRAGHVPEVAIWIDGTFPFRAETLSGYARALHVDFLERRMRQETGGNVSILPADVETRFWYNQELKSKYAMVPGLIAVVLVIFPAIFTTVAVVREKELGSITNLYATPIGRLEFLIGKQLPYVALSLADFVLLVILTVALFGVPFKGSAPALAVGTVIALFASTSIGLLVSTFTRTQMAGVIVTLIITAVPAFLYSGLFIPVEGFGTATRAIAQSFPAMYHLNVNVATFTKGLGLAGIGRDIMALALLFLVFTGLSTAFLRKQER